jgi:alkylated DNA repair dioxygenase AlkB
MQLPPKPKHVSHCSITADDEMKRIPMPDADVHYLASMKLPASPESLLQTLIATVPWSTEDIVLWGKRYAQPRLVAWYGDPGCRYTYSGVRHEPLAWSQPLLEIKRIVEGISRFPYNSVLLNYYRDHRDSMGFHSDDEPELGRNPNIASVSLGERRTFVMKHKKRNELKPVRLPLDNGSLLLMRGTTQSYWRHGIGKGQEPCGPRVNLTFRRVVGVA